MDAFVCQRCGNSNERYIGHLNGKPYCRKCILFNGENAPDYEVQDLNNPLKLAYELTAEQKDISQKLLRNFQAGIDTLVAAVCGAGKTEICYETINYALSNKKLVGFAIPRRDVVIELAPRIKEAFPDAKVTVVYGGHTDELLGDIVLLTTHQLYRYKEKFDLLILDEIDAFPFKHNDLLIQMFQRSIKGNHIIMSATAEDELKSRYQEKGKMLIELNVRFHHHKMPVPKIIRGVLFIKQIVLVFKLSQFIKRGKQTLVFAPTIALCEQTYNFLKHFVKNGNYVHSRCLNRAESIQLFKSGKYKYLVTTSVLERGVTIEGLQVIVIYADHALYDKNALVQISGRVGRKANDPNGEVIFLADKKSKSMEEARNEIRAKNASL